MLPNNDHSRPIIILYIIARYDNFVRIKETDNRKKHKHLLDQILEQ